MNIKKLQEADAYYWFMQLFFELLGNRFRNVIAIIVDNKETNNAFEFLLGTDYVGYHSH